MEHIWKNKEKGITLIALVVTIIILLILAGVSISTLGGENGLITRAIQAEREQKKAQYFEEIKLEIFAEQAERQSKAKEEVLILSLKKRIQEKSWTREEYVLMCKETENGFEQQESVEENNILLIETNDGYEIIIDVDNVTLDVKIREDYFEKVGERLTVILEPNGENGDKEEKEIRKGFKIKLEEPSYTNSGYKFVGWSESSDGSGTLYLAGSEYKVEENIRLYAIWKKEITTVTVHFDGNTGEGKMEDINVEVKIETNLPENEFTKEDYKFIKWNTKSDGTGQDYTDKITISEDTTLYAIWELKSLVDYWPLLTSLNSGLSNGSALVTRIGNNYNFTSGCLQLTDTALSTSSNYSLPSEFTVSIKYKPETLTPWTMILGKITAYTNLNTYNGIFIHNKTSITRLCNGTNNPNSFDISDILEIGNWSTLTFSYDGSKSRLYKDGELVTEQSGYTDLNDKLYLGGSKYSMGSTAGMSWKCANGYYKEFRIYDAALTQDQIMQLN